MKSANQNHCLKKLFALGIRYVGAGAAQKLADHFHSLDEIIEASTEQIEEVQDIGSSISNSLKEFFSNNENINIV